ncbi:site-specific DNA-methyltransferase [Bosea sp. FBZP-16]|uniref:DNA-methyltransferase n=1 Tax=Bosea sp. FBZP-16 TaxID=2065382 RepID=UPI0018F87606|nr:site-specific DNA-methyltransferase [Bosea sp. FBZP-16]
MRGTVNIIAGDCRATLAAMEPGSVNCCVTSPPYFGLRDYGHDDQIGLEPTPDEFVAAMVTVFREVRRVLRDDGTLWLNLGDSYASGGGKSQPHRDSSGGIGNKGTRGEQGYHASGGGFERPNTVASGLKPKDLIGIPWRVAFALQSDGWYLRQDIIWHKPNPMPESVKDRCTKAHEYVFMLSKAPRYYYDGDSVKEPAVDPTIGKFTDKWANKQRGHGRRHDGFNGRYAAKLEAEGVPTHRNRRSVWTVATKPFSGAHFATFPPDLIEPCILAGCPEGGTVLDPFGGAGTTGLVAARHGRNAVLCELNPEYAAMARDRIDADTASPLERARRKAKPANDNDLFGVAV